MCEHCGDPSLEWETLIEIDPPPDEEASWRDDVAMCDHTDELPEDREMTEEESIAWLEEHSCFRPATVVERSTWPMDHLCEEHKSEEEAILVDEYGEVPDPIGLEGTDRFLPIKGEETCQQIDHRGVCGAPASWVMIGTVDVYRCDVHLPEDEGVPRDT